MNKAYQLVAAAWLQPYNQLITQQFTQLGQYYQMTAAGCQ
jgi:hypothetical protein